MLHAREIEGVVTWHDNNHRWWPSLSLVPPGAMWDADWWHGTDKAGPDGLCLIVKLPNNSDWAIDGRCYNCDSPCKTCGIQYQHHPFWAGPDGGVCMYEDVRPHKCWVRHGVPPLITVDKNGVTCGAGAGSIQSGDWHGFLTNGVLSVKR